MEALGGVTRAQIEVDGTSVPYRRAGEGAPILLLRVQPRESDPAFGQGAERGRVFAPLVAPPLQRDRMEAWLLGLIEGLGLRAPGVVADAALAPLLARLVRHNAGLLGEVVFLAEEAGHGTDPGARQG
jgi:hypothetical protein